MNFYQVAKKKGIKISREEIEEIVKTNDKKDLLFVNIPTKSKPIKDILLKFH